MSIDPSEWVWQGHAGHFIHSSRCEFRLATRVGAFLISTVGDYYLEGKGYSPIGSNNIHFETMVFHAAGTQDCGCAVVSDFREIEGSRYQSAAAAQAGHMATCRKYAHEGQQ